MKTNGFEGGMFDVALGYNYVLTEADIEAEQKIADAQEAFESLMEHVARTKTDNAEQILKELINSLKCVVKARKDGVY